RLSTYSCSSATTLMYHLSLHDALPICFDQSYHRHHELSRELQRAKKMQFLQRHGIASFYYVSHAPFLFMARKAEVLHAMHDRLRSEEHTSELQSPDHLV